MKHLPGSDPTTVQAADGLVTSYHNFRPVATFHSPNSQDWPMFGLFCIPEVLPMNTTNHDPRAVLAVPWLVAEPALVPIVPAEPLLSLIHI